MDTNSTEACFLIKTHDTDLYGTHKTAFMAYRCPQKACLEQHETEQCPCDTPPCVEKMLREAQNSWPLRLLHNPLHTAYHDELSGVMFMRSLPILGICATGQGCRVLKRAKSKGVCRSWLHARPYQSNCSLQV